MSEQSEEHALEASGAHEMIIVVDDQSMTPTDVITAQREIRAPPALVPLGHAESSSLPNIVQAVEALDQAEALGRVGALREEIGRSYFELGGVLSVIKRKKWFAAHGSFRSFVENELGKGYRSALDLVQIYDKTVEIGLSFDEFRHLGWTVMRVLVPILTKENAAGWIDSAGHCARLELEEMVALETKPIRARQATEPKRVDAERLGFNEKQRAIVDPALERARLQSGLEHELDLLGFICEVYFKRFSLTTRLRQLSPDAVAILFGELLENFNETEAKNVLRRVSDGHKGTTIK